MSEQLKHTPEDIGVQPPHVDIGAPELRVVEPGEQETESEVAENTDQASNEEKILAEEKLSELRSRHRSVGKKGLFSVDNIRYLAPNGTQYEGEEVVILRENLAGFVRRNESSGQIELTHLAALLNRDDPRLKSMSGKGTRGGKSFDAGVALTDVRPFVAAEHAERLSGETEEEYQERLKLVQTDQLEAILRYPEEKKKDLEKELEKLREGVFAYLEEGGLMERLSDGTIIVDDNKLITEFKNIPSSGVWSHHRFPEFGAHRPWEKLQNAFRGIKVVSRLDYETAIKEKQPLHPKPLFYAPLTPEAALDARQIKEQDFYISPNEMPVFSYKTTKYIAQNGEPVASLEASLACLIYHPKYGNGHRDQNGVLQVWSTLYQKFRPISVNWFQTELGRVFGSSAKNDVGIWNPRRFLSEKTPGLVERGLLVEKDFKMTSTSSAAETHRVIKDLNKDNGMVMLDGVRYYIGKGEKFKDTQVAILAPNLGGVISNDKLSGRKKLTRLFDLVDRNTPGFKPANKSLSGEQLIYSDKKQTKMRPFTPDKYFAQRADESHEAYVRRLKAMEDVDYLLQISEQFSREAGVSLTKMDFADQGVIVDAAKGLKEKPERLLEFGKNYGLDGLQTFTACAYGDEYGERVLKVGENYEPAVAKELFGEFAQIKILIKDTGIRLADIFGAEQADFVDQFQEALTRRLKDIINTAYQLATKNRAEATFYGRQIETGDKTEPIEALRNVRRMMEVVSKFLSGHEADQEIFKFLAPVLNERAMAVTPQGVTNKEDLWKCYRFALAPLPGVNEKPSQLMVQLRQYGAPVRNGTSLHNKEIEFDGEARINFVWITDPEDAEGVYVNTATPERQRAISFRLDREGKVRDKAGNLIPEKNDPTRAQGELSLEIGAVPFPDNPTLNDNTVIGKSIAIGQYYSNQHDRREQGNLPQYYHNRASFSGEYGQADFFAKLVEKMGAAIEEKYTNQ